MHMHCPPLGTWTRTRFEGRGPKEDRWDKGFASSSGVAGIQLRDLGPEVEEGFCFRSTVTRPPGELVEMAWQWLVVNAASSSDPHLPPVVEALDVLCMYMGNWINEVEIVIDDLVQITAVQHCQPSI